MANRIKEVTSCQVQSELERLNSADGLPFQHLLCPERIRGALERAAVEFRDRILSPTVTLWAFLSQVMDKNGSCENAVSRVLADRVARGKKACSADNSSYCQARGRLPQQ